jgi:hypothetical protein
MADEEVEKLAESLKSSGLAASMMDAMDKAREILGHSNKGVKIRVSEPEPAQKAKVDEIIKEVDDEIQSAPKEVVTNNIPKEPVSEEQKDQFSDPQFNVADSGMNVKELTNDEIMTNDPKFLEQEKQDIEQGGDSEKAATSPNVIMTNDELNQKNIEEQSKNLNDFSSQEFSEEEEGDSDIQIEEPKKPELTSEEKEKTDLSKLFNFGN